MIDFLNSIIVLLNFIIIPGISYGSQLALGALGVTFVYAILRFANFAHGEIMSFGAMITILFTWFFQSQNIGLGVLPTALLALPIGIIATIILCIISDKFVFQYYRYQKSVPVVLAMVSIGVMFVINAIIRIIIGNYRGYSGPVKGISSDPIYLDIFIPANKIKTIPIEVNKNVLAYIFEGSANFEYASKPQGVMVEKMINEQEVNIQDMTGNRTLINFDRGDEIKIKTSSDGVRFLLIGGTPIQEPVAWHGPIVMNTNEELMQAIKELNNGTFIKK